VRQSVESQVADGSARTFRDPIPLSSHAVVIPIVTELGLLDGE
jgi:hypothetical protein